MTRRSNLFAGSFNLLLLFVLAGCAPSLKQGIYLSPDFQKSTITELEILPAVDSRIDKKIEVDFQKKIREAAAKILKKKGYKVQMSDDIGDVGQIKDEDLKAADSQWIKRLGPAGSRYVMVLCLIDVTTKLTFGSTGNAELAGYLYDKEAGIIIWRDKGIGRAGQGGLIGMAVKGSMGNEAILASLKNLFASIPKKSK